LDDENPITFENKTIFIRFQYRELTNEEVKEYDVEGGSNTSKQEKINQKSFDEILKRIEDVALKATLTKEYKNEKSLLLYQINRFTSKNTKDYFIHKNLRKFLSEQLDYFIKSEVLDIETIEKERFLDKHITRAKVVREIGENIIDFLSQIEDFQKRLWEKKKFVIKTDYVITLDKIKEYAGEDFLNEVIDEVLKNEEQLNEWRELGFGEIKSKDDLLLKNNLLEKTYKKLPIDTKYFSEDFKERLLEKLTEKHDLDDILDGLLIKSENWQALNLLLEKYKEKVQTIYIDPPFNKEQDADYLYNVKYKDSTWASMLENRLRLARDLMNDRGSIFVRCDYNGNWLIRPLMDEVFGKENFRNEIILQRGMQTRKAGKRMLNKTDSLFFYFKNLERGYLNILEREKEHVKCFNETLKVLEKLDIPLHILGEIKNKLNESLWMPFLSMPGEQKSESFREIFGIKLYPPKGRHWAFTQENLNLAIKNGIARLVCKKCGNIITTESHIRKGKCEKCNGEEFEGQIYSLYNQINDNWTDIPGYEQDPNFPTRNSEILLKRVIKSTSNEGDLVMDFFLGSGTTTAVAHKLKRKWIGVEMGEHFWTVVLPRMKKVLAYDKSGISKEKDVKEKYNEKTAGGFFKYQILEQYEDSLDNIELKENQKAQELFKDEYLLKYFLDYETRENPSLLNIEHLKNPFSYKLKVNLSEVGEPEEMIVDIPETFNYLLGLKVKKVKTRNNGRKYLFILGEKEGKDIAIVWREYDEEWSDEDFKKDKELIIKELKDWNPQIVYVNGQSVLTPKLGGDIDKAEIRYIEPEFKKLMEG
ncbi:MAG: site-specific DNA-methyltransferase, partial [candidate division WOR-3 bacterium]